jgi:hypothetical protein
MIRDMMVQCAEKRFGTIRAPHPVQWLSDNGSIFATHKTIEIALALNLAPCSNAAAALAATDHWMEDYNTVYPHSRLGYRSPRKYILSQTLRVRFNGVNSTDVTPLHRGSAPASGSRFNGVNSTDVTLPTQVGGSAPASGSRLRERRPGVVARLRRQRVELGRSGGINPRPSITPRFEEGRLLGQI